MCDISWKQKLSGLSSGVVRRGWLGPRVWMPFAIRQPNLIIFYLTRVPKALGKSNGRGGTWGGVKKRKECLKFFRKFLLFLLFYSFKNGIFNILLQLLRKFLTPEISLHQKLFKWPKKPLFSSYPEANSLNWRFCACIYSVFNATLVMISRRQNENTQFCGIGESSSGSLTKNISFFFWKCEWQSFVFSLLYAEKQKSWDEKHIENVYGINPLFNRDKFFFLLHLSCNGKKLVYIAKMKFFFIHFLLGFFKRHKFFFAENLCQTMIKFL